MDEHEPPTKRPRELDTTKCIICFESLCGKQKGKDVVVKNPTCDGIATILKISQMREDEVFQRLSPFRDEITSGQTKVSFHKSCRATYTSITNTSYSIPASSTTDDSTATTSTTGGRRSCRDNSGFNIRADCFICGKAYKRAEKLTHVQTGTGETTRNKVLSAAADRSDNTVHVRMLAHPDLFAFDAKYHRTCYQHYISERNIAAEQNKVTASSSTEGSCYDKAFRQTSEELDHTVLSKDMDVSTLSRIRSSFVKALDDLGVEDACKYSSWKLKQRIKNHYGDQIVFVERPGRSDLICSSTMTVGDALAKSNLIQESDDSVELEDLGTAPKQLDEVQVLHMAAAILRNEMAGIEDSDVYVSSLDINITKCGDYVPNLLYDFNNWCTNKHAFENVSTCSDAGAKKDNLKIISVCQSIISQCQHVRTPIALGLGLRIHHSFGSKQLLDELNTLGYTVSYDEVRRFLTSAAIDQKCEGPFVPKGIRSDGDKIMVDAAIDNFDQNEQTLDGKASTHSMASVLYKRGPVKPSECQMPRVKEKSLSAVAAFKLDDDIDRYNKPTKRPEPPAVQTAAITDVQTDAKSYKDAEKKDLVWALSRLHTGEDEKQNIPGWTGFNSLLSKGNLPIATVHYMPFIRASPSDMSTIYTILLRLVELAEQIGQPHILVTADMAIYSKAQQIIWNKPPMLDGKVTMRLGGMHTIMALLASFGKLYSDGGLLGLLTASNVYAEATARQMLQGTQVARGIRGIKIVFEALFRVFHSAFQSWFQKSKDDPKLASKELTDLQHAFRTKDDGTLDLIDFTEELMEEQLPNMMDAMAEFTAVGRQQSATFALWDDFMKGAKVMLHLLRAERDGIMDLHLNALCEAIPWFRAAGRHNYAKYVPLYITDMKNLAQDHPESYQHMCHGGLVVRRSPQYNFNAVSTDQALEQTINKEGKSEGGIIGLTLRKAALARWFLTRHTTAEYAEAFKSMCNDTTGKTRVHGELGKTRMSKDELDVKKVVALIEENQNPFDLDTVPSNLTNILTGQVASPAVSACLSSFLDVGKKKHDDFMENRLVEESKSVSLWYPESRTKIVTFADMRKEMKIDKTKGVMVDSEVLFRRLLGVSKQRDVNLRIVLQHELAAVPPSLFHDDGNMRKCVKADLAKKLEACTKSQEISALPENADTDKAGAYIFDGMALLHNIHEAQFHTFEDLGRVVLQRIKLLLRGKLGIKQVVLVFDRYDAPNSIKHHERVRRGASVDGTTASHVITRGRVVPNYRNFLKSAGNKASLALFISDYILEQAPTILMNQQSIVLAGGFKEREKVTKSTLEGITNLEALYSTQEEADTRMVLHAVNLAPSHQRIILRCDDTDVLVILLYYCSKGMLTDLLYMHAGHTGQHTNKERFIPVHEICTELGPAICQALPAIHALTGCDSTSSMYKIGKRTAFTKLVKHANNLPALTSFGMSESLDESLPTARKYVLALYGENRKQIAKCSNLDDLRYEFAIKTDKPATSLPPSEDAFSFHVQRAKYQTAIWTRSDQPRPSVWSPVGNGWELDAAGILIPILYRKDSAPLEVRDLTHLYCTDKDCSSARKCHCLTSGFQCTDLCSCHGQECSNAKQAIVFSDSEHSEDEDDSDSDV